MLIEGPSRNGAFGRQMRMDAGFSACNLAQLRPPYVAELTGARLSRMLKAPYGNEDLPAARLPARLRGFPSD